MYGVRYSIIPGIYDYMYVVWYEIIPSIFNYIKLYRCMISIIKRKWIAQNKCCQKKKITVTQRFLHCTSEKNLGVKNTHDLLSYVNKNDVESKTHEWNRITRELKHPQKYLLWKYRNKMKYSNSNTSVLPLKEWNIFLDAKCIRMINKNAVACI